MEVKEFNILLKEAILNGDSLEKLYSFYCPRIINHISIKFRGTVSGDDIAQEFFARLLEGKYSEQSFIEYPTAWIYRCCDNIVINNFKYESRLCSYSVMEIEAEDMIARFEYGEELAMYLNTLNTDEKFIIYLHYIEGYSLKEIAEINEVTYGSVKQKHSRIKKKLKKLKNSVTNAPFKLSKKQRGV